MRKTYKDIMTRLDVNDFCRENGISYLGVFGSYARGVADKSSDVDLVVRFKPEKKIGLFGLYRLQENLKEKLGKEVDLVTKLDKYIEPHVKRDLIDLYKL